MAAPSVFGGSACRTALLAVLLLLVNQTGIPFVWPPGICRSAYDLYTRPPAVTMFGPSSGQTFATCVKLCSVLCCLPQLRSGTTKRRNRWVRTLLAPFLFGCMTALAALYLVHALSCVLHELHGEVPRAHQHSMSCAYAVVRGKGRGVPQL